MTAQLTAPKIVKIKPQNFPGSKAIYVGLQGDASYVPNSNGGWQVIDRPKRTSATQWMDRPVWTLTLTAIISKDVSDTFVSRESRKHPEARSIEPECLILESWLNSVQGSLEPPVFRITGPIPGTQHYWVLSGLEFSEALRNPIAGFRFQQNIKLTFMEYQPPYGSKFNNVKQSHVDNYKYDTANGTQIVTMYQIGSGDTIQKIANKFHLGQDGVNQLKSMNQIRDPRNLVVGQTIMIPGYQ